MFRNVTFLEGQIHKKIFNGLNQNSLKLHQGKTEKKTRAKTEEKGMSKGQGNGDTVVEILNQASIHFNWSPPSAAPCDLCNDFE